MKFRAIFLLVALCVVANGQEPEVIRTKTELVQTAITVLDKKGHFVEGLQRDQFQLMVDGKPRQVAFFERVAAGSSRELEIATANGSTKPETPTTAAPRIPGRTIVFFIDDLHLSPDSMNRTRMMLQHFLDEATKAKADLCAAATQAEGMNNALLLVVGYTDSTGSQDLNQTLSEKRASRVVNFLQQECHWKPYRMLTPTGMSEADPAAPNDTAAGKAQNRRVAVNIMVSKGLDGM